jgi:cell division protease FtsH
LREADERSYSLLEQNRADLDRLAEALLQREELHREEIDYLLREGKLPEADGQKTDETLAPVASIAPA